MASLNSKKTKIQLNVSCYTLFLFLMVIFLSSLAFAPWTTDNPPESPRDGSRRTCTQWIIYHGFTEDDYEENRRLSLDRNYKLDKDASTWAAIYAFKIGGEETPPELIPAYFCNSFGIINIISYPYIALKDELRSCESWISLYRMTKDNPTYNIEYAKNQDIEKLEEISIWAYDYFRYLRRWGDIHTFTPSQFCTSIGKKVGKDAKLMEFINVKEPRLTCEAWMHQYEYSNDLQNNYFKVQFREWQFAQYKTNIHFWPRYYGIHLRNDGLNGPNFTPLQYCLFMGATEEKLYSFKFSATFS